MLAAMASPAATSPSPSRPAGPRGLDRLRNVIRYARDPFDYFERVLGEYGPIVLSESFGFQFYIITSPADIEHVLIRNAKNYSKDFFLRSWKRVFGEGLLTSEGEHWRRERRMVQPSFHRERLRRYGELMIERTLETFDRWAIGREGDADGRVIRVDREMMALTLDIVVRALFGTKLAPGVEREVAEALDCCVRYFAFTSQPAGYYLAKLPLPLTARYRAGVARLDRIIAAILEERLAAGDPSADRGPDSHEDLLSTLIAARDEDGSRLGRRQIRDELITLFLAGHDTTALALTYSLHLLARHPEIQARARAHVRAVRGDGPLQVAHLEELTQVRQIVQEALRLYPPAWVIAREAQRDDSLSGYAVPAGADVVIPIRAIHRKADVFPEPDRFRPERWTEEFQKQLPRTAYLPFGYGPRMCIGAGFAMMEAQLILAAALDRFAVSVDSPAELRCEPSITAKPKGPVLIRFRAPGDQPVRRAESTG
jgi:cytochrome P450